jgi:hypothetical protein
LSSDFYRQLHWGKPGGGWLYYGVIPSFGVAGIFGVAEGVEHDACEDADTDEDGGDDLQNQCDGIDNSPFCAKLCCVGWFNKKEWSD